VPAGEPSRSIGNLASVRIVVGSGLLAADVHGTGHTVVLLPGQSLGPEVFDDLVTDLATDLRVVVVHTRGTGASEFPAGEWTTGTFAADVVTVLDELGVDRAHVLGFSMGGRVAQVLAAKNPDRVDRIVLGATGPGGPQEVQRDPEISRRMRHTGTPEGRAALLELFFTPGWIARNPAVAERFTPRGTPRVRRAHHVASTTHASFDLLPAITAPTLVLHGADDAMTPVGNAELLAAALPDARLEVLPGVRHGYLAEARTQASALTRAHLA
jgi:3-oxoadipate enol-lactonase